MRSALRVVFVALLAVGIAASTAAECAAGALTPAQKACCETMGHDCGEGGGTMDCCRSDQHSRSRLIATATKSVVPAPVPLTGPLSLTSPPILTIATAAVWSSSEQPPKLAQRTSFLLLSVLRI